MNPSLEKVALSHPDAARLVAALDMELRSRYPEPGTESHLRLDEEEVSPGRGAFLVARADGVAVGCGAIRLLEPRTAEVKRMYTVPAARGSGIARRILEELEAEARRLGARRLVLESGVRQPESLALYQSAGFRRTAPYGAHVGGELSVCMEKDFGGGSP